MNICERCGSSFKPIRNSRGRFCSRECFSGSREVHLIPCARTLCENTFRQRKKGQMFCSQSCAAKVNNVKFPKRGPEGSCFRCDGASYSGRKYCPECWQKELSNRESQRVSDPRPKEKRTKKLSFCKCGEIKGSTSNLCRACFEGSRPSYEDWLDGTWNGSYKSGMMSVRLRKMLLEAANYTCQSPTCPVPGGFTGMANPTTGNIPLEIDHINGDCTDNSPENIIVLCPTCHALTPTYRSLNRSSKRTWRRKVDPEAGGVLDSSHQLRDN